VRRNARIALGALGLAVAAAGVVAVLRPTPRASLAYVAVAGNNHVQVVDLDTGRVLRRIYSGATPWRLVPAPDGRRLWIQHWYAGTTAVVDLDDHEIVGVVPSRGPGAFTPRGDRFLTFDWPASTLRSYDPRTLDLLKEQTTEVPDVYDLAPTPEGDRLYLAQFDPMARGPRQRYGYVLSYPHLEADPARAVPTSHRTGKSPVRVRTVSSGDFILTVDRETNGLTLINRLGDGRAVSTCPSPQAAVLSRDEKRLVVACWHTEGGGPSRLVSYRTDFGARPWPVIREEAALEVAGGLVAGTFSPSGDRVYVVDRIGRRLLELDPAALRVVRELPTGDEPVDVVVLERPAAVRERLASGDGRARSRLKPALARLQARMGPTRGLVWTETVRWLTPQPEASGSEDASKTKAPSTRRLRASFRPPDAWRTESEEGVLRLAQGGHTVTVDRSGRFWVAPRQELIAILHELGGLTPDDALRRLAGDVPGSPFLRGGLAVDVVREIQEAEARYVLVGASKPGERVAQLWIDAETGRPTNLVEQFPIFGRGHARPDFGGLVETKFYDFVSAGGGDHPVRLERVIDGRARQEVRIEGLEPRDDLPAASFDLARLGGVAPPAPPAATRASGAAARDGPGRAVPILGAGYLATPQEPHPSYNSNPPTSGPRLPYLADWGVHRVPVPLELQVHNLEHGGIAIQYNCPDGCSELVSQLEAFVKGRDALLLAPYPFMDARLALTAWGQIELMDALDMDRVRRFVDAYAGKDHHEKGGPLHAP
jgi:DNA-binding beta-propeller fold protein YncE